VCKSIKTTKLVHAGEHYSLFVVCHVGTARLDTLVSTRSTRRVVSRRDVTSQVEFVL